MVVKIMCKAVFVYNTDDAVDCFALDVHLFSLKSSHLYTAVRAFCLITFLAGPSMF